MNRVPGPNDTWWSQHQATCNGSFIKIKEPENFGVKKKKEISGNSSQSSKSSNPKKPKLDSSPGVQDIRGFFNSSPTAGTSKRKGANQTAPNPTTIKGKSLKGSTGPVSNEGSSTVTVKNPNLDTAGPTQGGIVSKPLSNFIAFAGTGHTLGGTVPPKVEKPPATPNISKLRVIETISLDDSLEIPAQNVECPICRTLIALSHMNQHLDLCLKL